MKPSLLIVHFHKIPLESLNERKRGVQMGYMGRKPTSNDLPNDAYDKSRWLEENEAEDEVSLLLNGLAKRCMKCRRAVRVRHLDPDRCCPDCR